MVCLIVLMAIAAGLAQANEPKQGDEIKNSLGMRLVYIPRGTFQMGSAESEAGRESQEVQHEVRLTKGYYLGVHEVTVGQFKQFVRDSKYQTDAAKDAKGSWGPNAETGSIELNGNFTWRNPGFQQSDDHPVVAVSWNDARAFCRWLSDQENKTYRLPTETEWEYACRARTDTAYTYGNDPAQLPSWANFGERNDGHRFTAEVGQFKKNGFGLHDMHGNVWEWCEDRYIENSYPTNTQTDPAGPAAGRARVQRGGGWSSAANRCRSAARIGRDPSAYRGGYLGFRVVLDPSSAVAAKESGKVTRPAGLRVMFNGNSWSNFVPAGVRDLVKSAGIEGHEEVKIVKTNVLSLVGQGKVDVYTHGVHWWTEPINDAEKLVAPALRANPKFRAYYHAAWLVNDGRHLFPEGQKDGIKVKEDYDASKIADVQSALDKTRKGLEAKADALNNKFGKPVVFIVPIGDAVTRLRAMVVAGDYPGVGKQSELFTDAMPHPGAHLMALSGYCHFAAIYRMSPVGLEMPRFKEIKPEQHAILQRIAWETVANYPYGGLAK